MISVNNLFKPVLLGLLTILAIACGGGGGGGEESPPGVLPDSTVVPDIGSRIRPTTAIVVNFEGSVATSELNLVYTGTLTQFTAVWSSETNSNDTLTITPDGPGWPVGGQTLNISIEDSDGTEIRNIVINYTVDDSVPGASMSNQLGDTIVSGNALNATDNLVITFTESMDPDSLNASGTFWDNSNATWSQDAAPNDTLTLSPNGASWTSGNRTLELDANDLAGNPLVTLQADFNVCTSNLTACTNSCVDTQNDPANCSECGSACGDGVSCSTDSCVDGACIYTPDDDLCANTSCSVGMCTGTGCVSNDLDAGTSCGTDSCGSWGSCGGFSTTCDETGTQTRSCTAPQCDGLGNCVNNNYQDQQVCVRNTEGVTCSSTVCGAWSVCAYTSICDEVAPDRTRTCTPQVCSGGACGSGTSYQDTSSCVRDTDGISCAINSVCIGGSCINIVN